MSLSEVQKGLKELKNKVYNRQLSFEEYVIQKRLLKTQLRKVKTK